MSYYKVDLEITMKYPASTVTRANGGFGKDDDEVIGRWVERDGTDADVAVLVAAGKRPLGVITRLTPAGAAVALGPMVQGKKSDDAAIDVGSRITGATRKESAAGNAERGFVTALASSPSVAALRDSVGYVLNGGSTTTANTEAAADLEVMMYN